MSINTARSRTAIVFAAAFGLSVGAHAFAAETAGQSQSCPASGAAPGIGHVPRFTDGNVALFTGGNYTVDGAAAEAEGLLVVQGKATFAKDNGGIFNVGRVGAGSGIIPAPGDVMLAVGGDLAIAKGTTVDVGSGLTAGPRYGGSVQVGGVIDEKGVLQTNGGGRAARLGAADALGTYSGFRQAVESESASLGSLKPTGSSVRAGGTVTFTSTAAGGLQVFEISAGDLDGASSFVFRAIPAGSSLVVNVTGTHDVKISPMSVGFNDDRVDLYSSTHFGDAATRILYNFRDSASIALGGGGNFMGSIVAPKASGDFTASTNGRVYVGGNLTVHGTGNETHNYPWTGSPVFTCKPGQPGQPAAPAPPATPGAPTPSAPSSGPGAPAPSAPASPGAPDAPAQPGGPLAQTGGSSMTPVVAAAAVVLAGGAVMLVFAWRRRRS
ncbi:choice-of-anchor A family protein [Yinghuangia seranimata]|uniref:choice-of-anchor A family protein n=1 Tax=Yinghuangia seranimata TaxID=408067 RepID=UPI00248B7CA4|nr:choice-of-anchor A family protein [Yinghuangia seranimata]MDI2130076.1 choice-of-anchor A family protein [Yinghuangia seranimata]